MYKLANDVLTRVSNLLTEAEWTSYPNGWNRNSLRRYWNNMTAGANSIPRAVNVCITSVSTNDGIENPAGFCSSIADTLYGTDWREDMPEGGY